MSLANHSSDTGRTFALIEVTVRKGHEPRRRAPKGPPLIAWMLEVFGAHGITFAAP